VGRSAAPVPGQPNSPIPVDRVVTDGASAYVQFHTTSAHTTSGPAGPLVFPRLSDDTGAPVNDNWDLRLSPPALPLPFAVPAWFPWRPFTVTRGVLTLGPLPVTAHAAALRFSTNGPLAVTDETVHVPLNLAAPRRIRANTGPLVQRAGLALRVVAARDTGLVLGYGLPDDLTSLVSLGSVTLLGPAAMTGGAVPR
jgi:hypothetical protein